MPRPNRLPRNDVNAIVNSHRGNNQSDRRIKDKIVELEAFEAGISTEDALIQAIEQDIANYESTKREELKALTESRQRKKNGKSYVEDVIVDIHYEILDATP